MRIRKFAPHRTAPDSGPLDKWLKPHFPERGPFRFVIYSGTPNLFVKETIQCLDKYGKVLGYIRIPKGPMAPEVIEIERLALTTLNQEFPVDPFFPKILAYGDGITLQTPPGGKNQPSISDRESGQLLERLEKRLRRAIPWHDSPVRATLVKAVAELRTIKTTEWAATIDTTLDHFDTVFETGTIQHVFSHGDFVPWNIRSGPFVFDWEWAAYRLPHHDAFHYLWMPVILKRDVDAESLWKLWTGPRGRAICLDKPCGRRDRQDALSYLAWQFAFYAGASARNGEDLENSRLLHTLHTLLSYSLSKEQLPP